MSRPFRFAVVITNALSRTVFVTLARWAEELGYTTLLLPDRTLTGLAPLTALATTAEATASLRVGSYVFCNDYRHPALLAKEVATLDFLSGGRFELGLGAGVGPFDYGQLGLPFEKGEERVDRFEEALAVMKQLFTEEYVHFTGKYLYYHGNERVAQAGPATTPADRYRGRKQTHAFPCCTRGREQLHDVQAAPTGDCCAK